MKFRHFSIPCKKVDMVWNKIPSLSYFAHIEMAIPYFCFTNLLGFLLKSVFFKKILAKPYGPRNLQKGPPYRAIKISQLDLGTMA